MMEERDELGGQHPGADPIADPPKSAALAKQLAEAKTELLRARDGLSQANREAITKKLEEANKTLKDFSHGNLIKSVEQQHKTLKDELISLANMSQGNQQEQRNKAAFDAAVQNYLNKRLELARIRLQEVARDDKQATYARKTIGSTFHTPDGRTGEGITDLLGSDYSHIERSEGFIFKSAVQVTFENGVLIGPPRDLALVAKAKGWNSFKFTKAKATNGGAEKLIDSVEEMLKVGIKDVSIDPKLMEKMLAKPPAMGHSSGDYAAQLARFMKGVSPSQKERLRNLRDICAASTGAYMQMKGNPVFNADGTMKSGADALPDPLLHQVNTFMRLTNDGLRQQYLDILFPAGLGKRAAEFVQELNKRKANFNGMSPEEYFRKKMLRFRAEKDFFTETRDRRTEFQKEHDNLNNLRKFNGYELLLISDLPQDGQALPGKMYFEKDGARLKYIVQNPNNEQVVGHLDINVPGDLTKEFLVANKAAILLHTSTRGHTHKDTTEERTASYLATNDESLLRRYARSEKLNGPDANPNQLRKDLVKAVFNDIQAPAAGAPNNPRAISLYNRTLSSQYSVQADDQQAFLLKTLALFENIKVLNDAGTATHFTRTAKEKRDLIRELRDEALAQYDREKTPPINRAAFDNFYRNKILLDQLEERMLNKQLDELKEKLDELLNLHLDSYYRMPPQEKSLAFCRDYSPQLQLRLWNEMNPADPQTTQMRAEILRNFIAIYEENPTPATHHFINASIEPLLKNMTRNLTPAELKAYANQRVLDGQMPDKAGAEWTAAELAPIQQAWAQNQRQGVTAMELMTQKLAELCQNSHVHGTKPAQNRALSSIRDKIAELGSAYQNAAAPLIPTALFKEYYNTPPLSSQNKILELLKCYAEVRKETSGPKKWLVDRKFRAEMRELFFQGSIENTLTKNLIESLYKRRRELYPNPEDKPTRHFIKALKELRDQVYAPKSRPVPDQDLNTSLLVGPDNDEQLDDGSALRIHEDL